MFLDQHPCWSWNNITITQSELRYNFSVNICFRLTITVRCFCTLVNQLSFPTAFRNKLWVGLDLGVGIGLSIFLDRNIDPGSTKGVDPGTCLTWQNHGIISIFTFANSKVDVSLWWVCGWFQLCTMSEAHGYINRRVRLEAALSRMITLWHQSTARAHHNETST